MDASIELQNHRNLYLNFTSNKYLHPDIECRRQQALKDIQFVIDDPSNPQLKKYKNDTMTTLFQNREIIIEAVQFRGQILEFATPDLRNDNEVVLLAVHNNGSALSFASERLQKNPQIILATEHYYENNAFWEGMSYYDYDEILDGVPKCYPDEKYKNIARRVVSVFNGDLMTHIRLKFQFDPDVVKIGLTAAGHDNAPEFIRNLPKWDESHEWTDGILGEDKELVKFAVRINPQVLNDIPVHWTTDDDVLNTAHAYFIEKIESTDFVLGNIETVDIREVEIIAEDFFYAHCLPELQNNRFPDPMYHDIALRMVQKFGRFGYPNLKYWCQVDHEILIALFRTDGPMIANIDKRSQDDDDDNLHEALANPEVQNAALDGIWKDIEYLWGEKSNELIEWVRRIVLRRASSDPQNIMVKVRVIHEAAEHGLDWDQGMEELLSNRELLHFRNEITGLLPFMTFAADHQKAVRPHIKLPIQNKSIIKPIDTLYKMIRLNPNLVKYDCN